MRRTFCFVLSALATFALLPSCQEKIEDFANDHEPLKVSVSALLGAHEDVSDESSEVGTRALATHTDANGKRWILATWKAGDKVHVYKVTSNASSASEMFEKVGVLTATKDGVPFQTISGNAGARFLDNIYNETDLTGELDADLELGPNDGLLFSYKHELGYDYTGQIGTLESIDANYDYALCYTTAKVNHDNHTLSIPRKITIVSQQAIIRFELVDEGGNPLVPSSLTIKASPYGRGSDYTPSGLMPFWGTDEIYEAWHMSIPGYDTGYFSNCDEIVVTPSSNVSNAVYVALHGNAIFTTNYGIGHQIEANGHLNSCVFDLIATVGSDTYSYHKSHWFFSTNQYRDIKVFMKKQTTSD